MQIEGGGGNEQENPVPGPSRPRYRSYHRASSEAVCARHERRPATPLFDPERGGEGQPAEDNRQSGKIYKSASHHTKAMIRFPNS